MGIRPRTKRVLLLKTRRCGKCGSALNRQKKRCKNCHSAQSLP